MAARPQPSPRRRAAPPPRSMWARMRQSAHDNPVKWLASVFGLIAAAAAAWPIMENWEPIVRWRMMGYVSDYSAPIVKLQADHDTYLSYLKLRDARQALKDAKDEATKYPGSTSAERAVEYYTDVIKKYQDQLDKAHAR